MGSLLFALVCAVTPFSADVTGVAQSTGLEEARTCAVFFSSDPAISSHLSDRKRKEFD